MKQSSKFLIIFAIFAIGSGWAIARLQFENRMLKNALEHEIRGCNDYVEWLDQCLDGRTCTVAGPSFKLHREFPKVILPHNVVSWEQACMQASGWHSSTK